MTNKELGRILQETAQLIELTGGNQYRARAFSNAARTIEQIDDSVADRAREGRLTELSGIGEGLAEDISHLVEDGSFPQRDELLDRIPPGLTDVLRVKGLGPKKVRKLWQELEITSVDQLEEAARAGRLTQISGFGKKTQQNVLEQVQLLREYMGRYLFAEAFRGAQPFLKRLRAEPAVREAELTGEARRRMEVIDQVEVAAAVEDEAAVREQLGRWLSRVDARSVGGRSAVHGYLSVGIPVSVYLIAPEEYGTALWELTGSDEHCEALIEAFGHPGPVDHETAVYENAGLSWIPPELREGTGELSAAGSSTLPEMITVDDLQGSIHNHTTYSDGATTVEEMARAAMGRGCSYLVICDHSRSLSIANGLSIERLYAQQEEIAAVNRKLSEETDGSFRIFRGTESDIRQDGSLDYPDEVLDTVDVVVASVHSRFNMTEEEATARIERAVEHPATAILGHPTGRLLLRREGYPINHRRIIEACAANHVAIELNANPRRLDLDWRWVREAVEQGAMIAINPDAHSIEELANVQWGVEVARKGWLRPEQCVNCLSLDQFVEWLNR